MTKELSIAIDGPSASGKGSLAEKLANYFNLPYLNTGAIYRFVALKMLEKEIPTNQVESVIDEIAKEINGENLENSALFDEKIGEFASNIAKNQVLRKKLLDFQKNFVKNSIKSAKGVVLDGRDIASTIMPKANFKIYVTADVETRAKRRFDQLSQKSDDVSYATILKQLKNRDENDKNRQNSPLIIDKKAFILDNSEINQEETFAKALEFIESKLIRK